MISRLLFAISLISFVLQCLSSCRKPENGYVADDLSYMVLDGVKYRYVYHEYEDVLNVWLCDASNDEMRQISFESEYGKFNLFKEYFYAGVDGVLPEDLHVKTLGYYSQERYYCLESEFEKVSEYLTDVTLTEVYATNASDNVKKNSIKLTEDFYIFASELALLKKHLVIDKNGIEVYDDIDIYLMWTDQNMIFCKYAFDLYYTNAGVYCVPRGRPFVSFRQKDVNSSIEDLIDYKVPVELLPEVESWSKHFYNFELPVEE